MDVVGNLRAPILPVEVQSVSAGSTHVTAVPQNDAKSDRFAVSSGSQISGFILPPEIESEQVYNLENPKDFLARGQEIENAFHHLVKLEKTHSEISLEDHLSVKNALYVSFMKLKSDADIYRIFAESLSKNLDTDNTLTKSQLSELSTLIEGMSSISKQIFEKYK
jgi:hypothetical protein